MRADKKKFSTRLMAALMAGTLAAGMMGMNVSAAGVHSGNPITTIPVIKSVYLIATRDLSNLWLQFFLSQNQGFMRLFEKTVLK